MTVSSNVIATEVAAVQDVVVLVAATLVVVPVEPEDGLVTYYLLLKHTAKLKPAPNSIEMTRDSTIFS